MQVTPTRLPRSALWGPALAAAAWALAVAGLGSAFTDLGPWYRNLKQPDWKPSDLWFGPVWTTIFALSAIALARAWHQVDNVRHRGPLVITALANGVLNVLWSVLFFTVKRPDLALFEVVFLWLSVLALMLVCRRTDRWAVPLLLPYLLWVGFAGVLNAAVVRLN
jgi:translocator protein